MIEKLEYGKSYAIYLNSLYGGYKSNVRIIGKTNIDNVVSNNDDDYNIYKTYFEPVGLGLNSYYSAIKPETTIFSIPSISIYCPTISERLIKVLFGL